MHLDRQTGAVHLPEAKEVLSHVTKPIIKPKPTKMISRSQWSCDNNARESRKRWEREQESSMGRSLQGGLRLTKGWGRHVGDHWEGTGINEAVSHRPEHENSLSLSIHLSPTGKSLACHLLGHREGEGLPVRGAPSSSSHSPLNSAKCRMLCHYLAVIH